MNSVAIAHYATILFGTLTLVGITWIVVRLVTILIKGWK